MINIKVCSPLKLGSGLTAKKPAICHYSYNLPLPAIAIDSFKIFAQNSLRNNFNQKKIDRHIDYIDGKIEAYEKELNDSDAEDRELIKAKIAAHMARKNKYEELDKALKESGESQVSLTDTDSRNLMSSKNISGVGYNIQAATEGKHKLFVHAHIGESTDKRKLAGAALDVKGLLGLRHFRTLSDAGYTTGDQLYLCKQAGITTYSSPMPSTSPSKNCYPLSHFIYYKEGDYYICPDGKKMTPYTGWSHRPNYKSKIYKTKACANCPVRAECTQNKLGRVIERSEYQDIIDENNLRVRENHDYYKLRQQIIEHPFGVLKRQWGFTYTLMKGRVNVLSEVNLLMIIYNLRRCMTIFGEDFKRRLKHLHEALCVLPTCIYYTFSTHFSICSRGTKYKSILFLNLNKLHDNKSLPPLMESL